MHALHAAFFMPLLLFQNGVLGRKNSNYIFRITSKNQRFFPVIPERENCHRFQCTHYMRHFLCLCCFSKTEFWGAIFPISNWDYLQKSKIFSGDPRGGRTGIVYNARIACGIFYAFVAFPKRSFGAQGLPAVIPEREN